MPKVGIVMGSDSDLPVVRKAADTLDAAARGQLQQSAAEAGVQNVVICSTESFQ